MVTVRVNGALRTDVEADTPVLWMLSDELRLTRTKFGGGVARSGGCNVCRCVPHAHFSRKR